MRAIRTPNDFAEAHWLLDYRFGFMKRGFLGSVCKVISKILGISLSPDLIALLSGLALAAFSVALLWVIWRFLEKFSWSGGAVVVSLLFVSSPFVVMSAHLIGYFDNILYLMAIAAILLVLSGRHYLAALVQIVAILTHESYLLTGYPLVLFTSYLIVSEGARGGGFRRAMLPQILPVVVFAGMAGYQSLFLDADLLRSQLSEYLGRFDFVSTRSDGMARWQTTGFIDWLEYQSGATLYNLLKPEIVISVGPSLLALLYFTHTGFSIRPFSRLSMAVLGACLVPLAMHLVAWDNSRISSYTLCGAIITLWVLSRVRKTDGDLSLFALIALPAFFVNVFTHIPLMDGCVESFSEFARLLLYAPALILVLGSLLPESAFAPTEQAGRKYDKYVIALPAVLLLIVLIRNAWICDDAYITLRTVDNFIGGYGLTWNIAERVQSFTHPLWMLLLSVVYVVTREAYLTTIILSIGLSLIATLLLAYRLAVSAWSAVLAVMVLIVSKAFIDFSTSGLENPMTNLVLVLFFIVFLKSALTARSVFWMSLLTSLGALSRLDSLLLFLPILIYACWKLRSRKTLYALLLGLIPLALWEMFSLIYYGFPFPNTAYAKLNTSIAAWDLIRQGVLYIASSFEKSPVVPLTMILALLAGFASRSPRLIAAGIGILLYAAYVVKVGGDFMTGRFLVAPFFVSVIILSQVRTAGLHKVVAGFLLVLGAAWPFSPLFSGSDIGTGEAAKYWNRGIGDERAAAFRHTGLLNGPDGTPISEHPWAIEGSMARLAEDTVVVRAGIGIYGYYAGPHVFILDKHALSDPLLARLPVLTPKRWRPGHFTRLIPEGYLETLEGGENLIADRDLAVFYERLALITRGDLFSVRRFKDIVKMNLGFYDDLVDAYTSRPMITVDYAQINDPVPENTPALHNSCTVLPASGIQIEFDSAQSESYFEIGLDNNDDYLLEYYRSGVLVANQIVASRWVTGGGVRVDVLPVPDKVVRDGFDRLVITGRGGDGTYSLSHFRLIDRRAAEMARELLQEAAPADVVLQPEMNLAPTGWSYDDAVTMLAVYAVPDADSLRFLFAYRAERDITEDYRVFFHVITEIDGTFHNYDFVPATRTHTWRRGAIEICVRTIPDPNQAFRVTTGLFSGEARLGKPFKLLYEPADR
ncbi:MAG: hypothetical protein JSW34_09270 [Candidatus Zixiibacteriota bacterium]|nr:MAG: hypothetical protein JSW34_09270 [candidate division Zixibacteria bacterium]